MQMIHPSLQGRPAIFSPFPRATSQHVHFTNADSKLYADSKIYDCRKNFHVKGLFRSFSVVHSRTRILVGSNTGHSLTTDQYLAKSGPWGPNLSSRYE